MKHVIQRMTLAAVMAACCSLAATTQAAYPEQPVKLIVPFAPGGPTDLAARIVAASMGKSLSQSLVVENRPGAGGRIGTGLAVAAKPDGYTMLVAGPSSLVVQSALNPPLPYDPQKQFTPVGIYAVVPIMLVSSPNLPAKDFREAVALFKANPGKYAYGSAGVGTSSHFGPYIIFKMLGADLVHVPYKGSGPAVGDTQAGRVAIALDAVSSVSPRIKNGDVRGMIVLEKNRVPQLPDVPAAGEFFPEIMKYDWTSWFGITAPTGTPNDAIETLHKAMITAASDPELVKRYSDLGMGTSKMSLPEVRQFLNRQFEVWVPAIKAMDLKLD